MSTSYPTTHSLLGVKMLGEGTMPAYDVEELWSTKWVSGVKCSSSLHSQGWRVLHPQEWCVGRPLGRCDRDRDGCTFIHRGRSFMAETSLRRGEIKSFTRQINKRRFIRLISTGLCFLLLKKKVHSAWCLLHPKPMRGSNRGASLKRSR